MGRLVMLRALALLASVTVVASPISMSAQRPVSDRVHLRFDTAEPDAVIAILEAAGAGRTPSAADWQRLFATEGYQRLKGREAAMKRAFTDAEFQAFVLSDSLRRRTAELRRTLDAWKGADVQGAARMALAYLPADARITATVYVMIKPRTNSFVWEAATNPAIFLYLDPSVTRPQFANTVAHELHHIGFASVRARSDSIIATLPDSVQDAVEWMGAFGEGFAMLAAAGGPNVHPHATSAAADRAVWDADIAHFNRDLRVVERFFLDVISKHLATPDTVRAVAASFYGTQGPWYTVGWKMAAMIEQQDGRAALVAAMTDPRRLLMRYNAAARAHNRTHADTLAEWSPALLRALGAAR